MKHTKIELSIHKKDFPEIKNAGRKVFIELFIRILSDYDRDVPFLGGTFLREHLVANQNYVDIFFILITYLSKHYKLHQRYFDLLNLAASHLERLYQEKIDALPTEEEKRTVHQELVGYLNKVAFIFQTAADNTEDRRGEIYAVKAQEYSEKADIRQKVPKAEGRVYELKILRLREEAMREFLAKDALFRGADEISEHAASPRLFKEGETAPFLRKSAPTERSTSSPSPS